MRKWWLLLASLALWNILGYCLARPPGTARVDAPPAASTPTRIVSLAPNLTEILYALGLEEAIVGVTLDSDYPAAAADRPKVGTFWQPNVEAVVALKPDLVVALDFQQQKSVVHRLERLGCRCLMTDIWTVDDFFRAVGTMGQVTGREQQAEALVADIQEDIQRLHDAIAGQTRPRALWVVQREPLRVAGRDTFINELIELAGGENAIGPTLHKYPPIGAEQVIACDAEVIIEPAMVKGDFEHQRKTALEYWSRWPHVPAVQAGRIHVIDGDIVSRLGPRLYQGIETIAHCLRAEAPGE
ncbi:MAG: ABC transporter substrate-binding protein [Phycisphaerales bacterium]|nr:MAG: ABC transporter substrate-binding protein [Phycisphaerales bacterium]